MVKGRSPGEISVACPPGVELADVEQVGQGAALVLYVAKDYDDFHAYVDLEVTVGGVAHRVPMRVFREREFFVVFVLQSNLHEGWNPRPMEQFYEELRGGVAGHVYRKRAGLQGPGASGHSFLHFVGDEEELAKHPPEFHYEPLERVLHDRGVPVTWLVDQNVAGQFASSLALWLREHHDCVGYLPSSYFYQNHVNYNVAKSVEETLHLLKGVAHGVEAALEAVGHPVYSRVAGVDQWVGSVGTNWVRAALQLDLWGLWGMGWDHRSCDTSMYHRGAPWNAYKPNPDQFRCVKRPDQSLTLWLFQWTIRDLVNALPLSPHGSVCFSTDPDDVRSQGIMALERQPTYFFKLLQEYWHNFQKGKLEYFVFLVHQEDHDAHFREDNEYVKSFVGELEEFASFPADSGGKPGGPRVNAPVLATLEEVAAWLNLKYEPADASWQYLELHDPLEVSTRKQIQANFFDAIARIHDPEEEEDVWRLLRQWWPAEENLPTTLAYFDETCLWLAQYPRRVPLQWYRYDDPRQLEVPEDGELFQAVPPGFSNLKETFAADGYRLEVDCDGDAEGLPWIVWKRSVVPSILEKFPRDKVWVEGTEALVFRVNLREGHNSLSI
ncbi:MAG: hypothetical protein Kow0069_28990 [Promethearchaeota archaeon]